MHTTERWLEDYEVGESRRSTGRTITEADIVLHAGQTGDFFPHHMDAEWAGAQLGADRARHPGDVRRRGDDGRRYQPSRDELRVRPSAVRSPGPDR